ncbi:MAG: hypothetical protein APR63_06665 [Desulfuromonas sp. SDB]|nr:MAG: hypothetical protein APR63_06665 [Desulfuromonas sp. SDB]
MIDNAAKREYQIIANGANWLDQQDVGEPEILMVMGSGLAECLEPYLDIEITVEMSDVPGISVPSAPFHHKQILFGTLSGHRVAVMTGRLHLYEGYTAREVVRPLRMISWLGTKTLIVTNAAGGLNEDMESGEVMVIEDHLNLMGTNPLIGPNLETLGTRFPMIAHAYSPKYIQKADEISRELNIKLHFGIYAGLVGPSFETGAETRMLKILGADAVGMSTVPEVIAAAHMGMNVLGMSVITNVNDPGVMSFIDEVEVVRAAKCGGVIISDIITRFLEQFEI